MRCDGAMNVSIEEAKCCPAKSKTPPGLCENRNGAFGGGCARLWKTRLGLLDLHRHEFNSLWNALTGLLLREQTSRRGAASGPAQRTCRLCQCSAITPLK